MYTSRKLRVVSITGGLVMTDRFNALVVILEKNLRDDDAASLIEAIKHIRGVLEVSGNIATIVDDVAQARVKREYGEKLIQVLHPNWGSSAS